MIACDSIDCMVGTMIGTGHGGLISNPVLTVVLVILKYVPFDMAVEIDKLFLN
jgi:hypothetical protein